MGGGGLRQIIDNSKMDEQESDIDPELLQKMKSNLGRPFGHKRQESLFKDSDQLADEEGDEEDDDEDDNSPEGILEQYRRD